MKSLSKIKGQIENVILYNKKDGFTIAKLKVQNQSGRVDFHASNAAKVRTDLNIRNRRGT
jgi:hypothetical protein